MTDDDTHNATRAQHIVPGISIHAHAVSGFLFFWSARQHAHSFLSVKKSAGIIYAITVGEVGIAELS